MSQRPFTTDRSVASTATCNASCEVGWHRVALVAQLAYGWLGGARLKWLGFIPQQQAGDYVPRLIVARSVAERSYPVLTIPGDDPSIVCKASTMLHHARGTEVLPHHFVLAGELQSDRSSHRLREYGRIKGHGIGTIQSVAARSAHIDHAHFIGRHIQKVCNDASCWISRLRCRPHSCTLGLDVGHRARGAD